ncbi:MAG: hypothetical protein GY759_00590 [Chloroflexi bacterium]|nr:hypothetical protein [Chloroflexota bacterium]
MAVIATVAGALLFWMLAQTPLRAQGHPCDSPNVIPRDVCNFDGFYGSPPRQLPRGWTPFVLSGELTYMQDVDTYWGAPSLRMWSNGGTFRAGLYTQVNVTPGAGYRASIAWGAPNAPDTFGRQLGIDPSGGTDPNAPTVVWGPMHWGAGRILNYAPPDVNIDVRARAQGDVVTVFFLVDHNRSTGDNYIFVDAISLLPDESAPAQATPTALAPTATPVPTNTPIPTLTSTPSDTATPTATASPTVTLTSTPTSTPTATATSTLTPTASPSPTATATPSPTPTVTPTSTPTPGLLASLLPSSLTNISATGSHGFDLIDLGGLVGLMMAVGLFVWLYRRNRP